jgi:hypothetical protein
MLLASETLVSRAKMKRLCVIEASLKYVINNHQAKASKENKA